MQFSVLTAFLVAAASAGVVKPMESPQPDDYSKSENYSVLPEDLDLILKLTQPSTWMTLDAISEAAALLLRLRFALLRLLRLAIFQEYLRALVVLERR